MLSRLSIRDVVLIDQLDLEFSPGFTILTGETGAGKSILLDALALALGARGDGGLVRHGQPQGQVTATFDLPKGPPAPALVEGVGVVAQPAGRAPPHPSPHRPLVDPSGGLEPLAGATERAYAALREAERAL